MKKWNRALAILLAAGMAASLCGCGSSADSSAPPSVPASQAVTPEPMLEPTPTPEPTPEPTPTPEPELHGLIYRESYAFNGKSSTSICYLNPETCETKIISTFGNFESANDDYYYSGGGSVSADFSKISCTKFFRNGGSSHAGWIDTEGNFFDVTEALGLQIQSDFGPEIHYYPVGFYNGLFGFEERKRESVNSLYTITQYYVPLDNISPEAIQKGDVRTVGHPFDENDGLLKNSIGGRKYTPADVTSWIDDTRCIVDAKAAYTTNVDSYIVDVATQTESAYIPGDSRDNWSGIISPDGTRIAFLSSPRQTFTRTNDIYITSVNGGDPVKVNCSLAPEKGYTLIAWI